MSVNDIVNFATTDDFEQLNMRISYLDVDLFQTNYVDSLTDIFLDQWDIFKLKKMSGHTRL